MGTRTERNYDDFKKDYERHKKSNIKDVETLEESVETLETKIITELDNKVDSPSASTDNAIAIFDGITGKALKDSNVKIDDKGTVKPNFVEFKGKTDWGNSGTSKTITEITTKMNFLTLTGNCVLTLPEFEYETECISFMIRVAQDSVGGRSLTINKSTGTAAINLSKFDFSTGTIGQYCWVTVLWDTEVLVFTSSKYI